MKLMRLFFLSFIISSSAFAQGSLEKLMAEKGIWFEERMSALHDSTFIAATEARYLEYLYFVSKVSKDSAIGLPMDTHLMSTYLYELPWEFKNEKNVFIKDYRFIDSTYTQTGLHNNLYFEGPAVAITYEQAKLFCLWKSNLYTKVFNKKLIERGDSLRVTYRFRLPTEAEWRMAFGEPTQYLKTTPYRKSTKWGLRKLKIKNRPGTTLDLTVKQTLPSHRKQTVYQENINFVGSVYAHEQNSNHCYNMLGNVAEMVDEKGIALGGSWRDSYDEIMARNLAGRYSCPDYALGFRCVCDVSISYHIKPDTIAYDVGSTLTDSCVHVRKRQLIVENEKRKNDPDYLENKIKEWVRKEKGIPLTDEVIYLNDIPTSSFETILFDSARFKVRVPYPLDSVEQILAKYSVYNDTMIPAVRGLYKKGEFQIRTNEEPVFGLFINLYYQGVRKTFFRVLRHR